MRKQIGLSGVALTVLMLATAPVGAAGLLGGLLGGSSDSGGSSPSGSTSTSTSTDTGISVTIGGNGGLLGNGRLLDLNGGDDTDAAVELNLGNVLGGESDSNNGEDGLIDLDVTDDDNGIVVDLFGKRGSVADVDIPRGGVLGGEGDLLGNVVSLDGDADAAIVLDLFGPASDTDAVADVSLGLGEDDLLEVNGDGDAAVNVNLFGRGSAPTSSNLATVDLGLGGTGNLIDPAGSGDQALAAISLFGTGGDDTDDTATGSVGGTPGGVSGGTSSSPGDVADNGSDPDDDGGMVTPAPGAPGVVQPMPRPLPVTGGAARVASVTTTGATSCFSPDQSQIAYLLARKAYTAQVTAQWDAADDVRLVPINLCADAKARLDAALEADPNIGTLQAAVAADAEISASLDPSYQPSDVLAVDQSDEDLTVYVY